MEIIRHRAGKVPGEGIYLMPPSVYHEDPAPAPSLSNSVARELIDHTPRHAWTIHPRLNPAYEPPAVGRKTEIGERVHDLVCGRGRGHVRVEANDWRTEKARAKRDEAVKAGKAPILAGDAPACAKMLRAIRYRMRAHPTTSGLFREGNGELVLIWQEDGIWLRTMIDWWGPTDRDITDLKTTTAGLDDRSLNDRFDSGGLDLQAAFHERAVHHFMPHLAGRLNQRFVFCEQDEPHEIRTVNVPAYAKDQGRHKLSIAMSEWRNAMRSGVWPGYPVGTDDIAPPEWSGRRWQEKAQALATQPPRAEFRDKRMQDLQRRLQRSAESGNVNVFG
jgi:hypothetical protein